ncbi:N-acetylneuraminate epimerase [subsurface metagenome]
MKSSVRLLIVVFHVIFYVISISVGTAWAQEKKLQQPPSMIYHNLVYHDKLDKIILLGGQSKHGWKADVKDVWMLDPENYTWSKLCKNHAVSDSGYSAHSPIYDKESNQIILFNQIGETWSFHVESKEWKNLNPIPSPSPRCGHNMVYDVGSDRVILFGGFECTGIDAPIYNDTWSYDFNSNTWTELNPENNPPNRMYASMINNSVDNKVILWGGRLWEPLKDNSIWEYDFNKNNWIEIINEEGPVIAYAYPSIVHIPLNNRLFLFGGGKLESTFVGNPVNDAWVFDCEARKWSEVKSKNSPPPVTNHSMIYLPKLNEVILFGGEIGSMYSNKILEGIWIMSIKDWAWQKK